jgi:hypothetical protein
MAAIRRAAFAGRSCGFAGMCASQAGRSVSFHHGSRSARGPRPPLPSGVRAGERPTAPAECDAARSPFGGGVSIAEKFGVDDRKLYIVVHTDLNLEYMHHDGI